MIFRRSLRRWHIVPSTLYSSSDRLVPHLVQRSACPADILQLYCGMLPTLSSRGFGVAQYLPCVFWAYVYLHRRRLVGERRRGLDV